ncbi:hypothetical protein GGX14DRAFT_573606 [Mycena pura]|uniref:F-box domain-containing protein n=1 Tax=Mycena pura TaxID=153505 RepID=A0AAD6V1N1_9AGAR|nr:hypothetical protein GGX14DRAFT_573606 [Mycena pura]
MPNLRTLALRNCDWIDKAVVNMFEILPQDTIQELELGGLEVNFGFRQAPAQLCPELLLTNSVPSDIQLNEIHSFIGSAKAKITILDDQISQMQRTLVRLESQRAELADLVKSHHGVVSTIRRLPRDILREVFSHYLGAIVPPLHSPEALLHLVGVCAPWRAIALASPLLWRHIRLTGRREICEDSGKFQQISLQLQRSAPVALSIHVENPSSRVMDLLLTESRRWQTLCLDFNGDHNFHQHLTTSKVEFPILEKLTLVHWEPMYKDIALFFESLPAMVDLTLDLYQMPLSGTLDFIWAQLRTCTLTGCTTNDILRVLPLFSAGTQVCLEHFLSEEKQPTSVHTVVSGLSLCCNFKEDVYNLLGALTAPCLERFRIAGRFSIPPIAAFFDRSSCALTHLGIVCNAYSDHLSGLLTLLRSPHASNIVDLDVELYYAFDGEKLTDALAGGIVPNLRGNRAQDLRMWRLRASRRELRVDQQLVTYASRADIACVRACFDTVTLMSSARAYKQGV